MLEIQERDVSFPPAHTAEHLLNQLMHRIFGCERSNNAHIERKKSKMTFVLDHKPDKRDEKEIETRMNELIQQDMPVTFDVVDRVYRKTCAFNHADRTVRTVGNQLGRT